MENATFWSALAAALGWMVAHSIWQIALFYLLYRLGAWCWPQHSRRQYLLALVGMAGSAVAAVVTFAHTWEQYAQLRDWAGTLASNQAVLPQVAVQKMLIESVLANDPRAWLQRFDSFYEAWAAPVGWLWGIGTWALALRFLGGYWLSRRLRRVGVSPVAEVWQQQCRHWSRQLGIRQSVRWLESSRVAQPLTLGFWKPVVLFPAGMLLHLSPQSVEMLLLHELAHIRRHDYLVNLAQLMLEACFFYHPLFWLLSKEVRRHREYCCDDLVLRHAPDRLLYAKTLTDLQQTYSFTFNPFAMHALGKSAFAQRITRLFHLRADKAQRAPGLLLLLLFLLAGAVLSWSASRTTPLGEPSELSVVVPEKIAPSDGTAPLSAPTTPKPEPVPATASRIEVPSDSLAPAVVAVGADKMNVFYIGVDNPITVAVPGYDCAVLSARLVGEGHITPKGECQYNVVVHKPGTVTVEIYATERGEQKLLAARHFRVKRIPDPRPQLGDLRYGNTIRQADLRQALSQDLRAVMDNFDFDAECSVVQFSIAIQADGGDVIEHVIPGNRLPERILAQVEKLAPGSKLYLLDIKIRCPGDAAPRNISDLIFRVVP